MRTLDIRLEVHEKAPDDAGRSVEVLETYGAVICVFNLSGGPLLVLTVWRSYTIVGVEEESVGRLNSCRARQNRFQEAGLELV